MPLNVPGVADEREGLLAFLAQQRSALKNAAYGLTEDQARKTTTGSVLSVGGLVKHVAGAERSWIDKVVGCDESDPSDYEGYLASFHLGPDETLAGMLELYDGAAERTVAAMAAVEGWEATDWVTPWEPETAPR